MFYFTVIKGKVKSMIALWEPAVVEESLAIIGWPKRNCDDDTENHVITTLFFNFDKSTFFITINNKYSFFFVHLNILYNNILFLFR